MTPSELLEQILQETERLEPPSERLGLLCSIIAMRSQMGIDPSGVVTQATQIAETLEGQVREDWLKMINDAVRPASEPEPLPVQAPRPPADERFPAEVLLRRIQSSLEEGKRDEAAKDIDAIVELVKQGESEFILHHVVFAQLNAGLIDDAIATIERMADPKGRLYAKLQVVTELRRRSGKTA